MSLYADVARVRAEAATLDPVKVFMTLCGLPFFVLFFVVRFVWMVPAFLWTAGIYGWRQADGLIQVRVAPAAPGEEPAA